MIRNVTLYDPERNTPCSTTQLKVFPNHPFYPQQPNINVFDTSVIPPIKQIHNSLQHNMLSSENDLFIPYKTSSPFLEHNVQTVNYGHTLQNWTLLLDGKHNYPKNSFQLRNTPVYFIINQAPNDLRHLIKFKVVKPP